MSELTNNSMAAKALSKLGASKGGAARAKSLSSDERSRIARAAVEKRWERAGKLRRAAERGLLRATHTGSFKDEFGIDVDCYVLNDNRKTAVVSQRGMGQALGFSKTASGSKLPQFLAGKGISPYLGSEVIEKLNNPLIFQGPPPVPSIPRSVEFTDSRYPSDRHLQGNRFSRGRRKTSSQPEENRKQAHIIINASAKAGIKGLVYALAGYDVIRER